MCKTVQRAIKRGCSCGGGLSIWTGHLSEMRHIPNYSGGKYKGPAFKVGVGAEVGSLYDYADTLNLSVVGGLGRVRELYT